MSYLPSEAKKFRIQFACEEGNWEPATYDQYDEESGWSYKTCEPADAYFLRHTVTGKMYRWNQFIRRIRYDANFKLTEKRAA